MCSIIQIVLIAKAVKKPHLNKMFDFAKPSLAIVACFRNTFGLQISF